MMELKNYLLKCLALAALTVAVAASSIELREFELKQAKPCDQDLCQLPNCRCSGLPLPKPEFSGREKEIPQFITVTFDDAINYVNYEQYVELFKGLTNPDHCVASGAFYVSHEYTDYAKVNALYTAGHEIALHSITHGTGTDYWRNADLEVYIREFGDQILMLETFAKIKRRDIRGMRLPFLQISGNNSFIAAKKIGLQYDASWPTQQYKNPAMWPYTLDYLSTQDCHIRPCPDVSLPGLWVNPMVTWTDTTGYSCAMIDGCPHPPADDVQAIVNWFLDNFNRHYEGNRAPFGMYLHSAWFGRGENYFKGFRKFLEHVNRLPDVYITTPSRVIQYMRKPVLGKPFKGCLKKPTPNCAPRSCPLPKGSYGEIRYMTVCDRCPAIYPWLNNPLGTRK